MATYEESGVNVEKGDKASESAYKAAMETFKAREGMIGRPVVLEGGFTGLMDFGDFYLVQNNDGVGTKTEIARMTKKYDTLGYDLVAMVADDAICVGAETVAITNTIDTDKVDPEEISGLMEGLKNACLEQKISVPGGEIGEMGTLLNGSMWNATCVGILEKEKFIDGNKIKAGDKVIALASRGFRSNGFSLIRYILKNKFGENWHAEKFDDEKTWGDITLTPSQIYQDFVLSLIGRYKQERKFDIHAIIHVTGGGIGNNLNRAIKKKGLGADLNNVFKPHAPMLKLQELGNVEDKEAYKTWNMGNGMLLLVDPADVEGIFSASEAAGIKAREIGEINEEAGVRVTSKGFFSEGEVITY